MRFGLRKKNAPENNSKAKPPPKRRSFRFALPLCAGITVAGFGVGIADLVRSMQEKRVVLQCKHHDVKEEPVITEKELTVKQARHLKPPENCEKKLCRWKKKGSRIEFYDCEPLTEEKPEKIKKSGIRWVSFLGTFTGAFFGLAMLMLYSSRLRRKKKEVIEGGRKDPNS